jgi:hypothetical protein
MEAGSRIPTRRTIHLRMPERLACQSCNNGWMSGLERDVENVLGVMITQGAPPTFSRSDQELVAAWLTKYVMCIEWKSYQRPAYFTPQERWWFRQTLKPPPGTTAWIAPVLYKKWLHQPQGHNLAFPPMTPLGRAVIRGISYTFNIFFFGFQFVHVRDGQLPMCSEIGWEQAAFQIWPIDPTQKWPPSNALRESQFQPFGNRWKATENAMKRAK